MKKELLILFLISLLVLTSCRVDRDIITKIEPITEENTKPTNTNTNTETQPNTETTTNTTTNITVSEERIIMANQNGIVLKIGNYNYTKIADDRGILGLMNITISNIDADTFTPEIAVVFYSGQVDPKDRATKSIKMNDVTLAKGEAVKREIALDLPFSDYFAEQNLIIYVYKAFSMPKNLLVTLETSLKFK